MTTRDPLLDALRRARRARASGAWAEPPETLVERAFDAVREERMPRVCSRRVKARPSADVRSGDSAAVADDARIVAASCPGGEISVLVHPPLRSAEWRFELRVWLPDADRDAVAQVALVHDDHVLHRCGVLDGRTVRFEEVSASGWTLEIHLPSGHTVVLDDPFTAE
jgi:hypothetical protein